MRTVECVDKETQIYPGDQELFDFDTEVNLWNILAVLLLSRGYCVELFYFTFIFHTKTFYQVLLVLEAIVGRTLEQSLLEVTEEEELATAR